MGNKKLLLICIFLSCIFLARTETTNAFGESTVYVDPAEKTVNQPDEPFNVTVKVTNAPEMSWYIINFTWDPSVIETLTGTDADVVKGTFLGGELFLVAPPEPGRLPEVSEAKLFGYVSGSGTLFTIRFRSKAVGTTQLRIDFAVFYKDLDTVDMPTRNNSTIAVVPEFPASLLLPFFLTATAIAFIAKTILSRKRRDIKIP